MNWNQIWEALAETLQMTLPSTLISYIIGLPLGVLLVITRRGGIRPMPTFNAVAGAIVNFLRSIPFIILLAMLFPVTRVVMGRAIGTVSVIDHAGAEYRRLSRTQRPRPLPGALLSMT